MQTNFVNGKRQQQRSQEAGFTLLEIMVVLALIGLVATAVGTAVTKSWRDGQVKAARIQVDQLSAASQKFMIDRSRCPTAEDLLAEGFIRKAPLDPWGKSLALRCPGVNDLAGVDIVSFGRDGKEGTEDDIQSWKL
jgi:general secretion pathway protein G